MSEIYIEYPKKWICLGPSSARKEQTTFLTYKTRFTLQIVQVNAFFAPQCEQKTVPQIWILFHGIVFQKKRGW